MIYRYFLPLFFVVIASALFGQVQGDIIIGADTREQVKQIFINWPMEEEDAWKRENEERLEIMGVRINLHSGQLLKSGVSQFQFHHTPSMPLEALMEVDHFEPGEKIYLKNKQTGDLLFTWSPEKKNLLLLPVFDPANTVLVWEGTKSVFHITTIYVHINAQHRSGQIGFNTANPCHPNAACKQDSLLQLISRSAVRMRMVMEEGIGWCTGAFVNNTRNDKSPYLLSAHHCTFNFTPKYELWRFDMEYVSDSCQNPAVEPAIFSITGCELKAKGLESDFLLVLLNEPIPSNRNITFAGWDIDDVETPDTSYLIHHPNADIRKISTCTNKADIHPNQIGWSEGYTTPGNHHFHFRFTEGGHQAGSSGGPVFNQDALLIGQLHGGSAGCEQMSNTFVGRISRSWELGTQPDKRLKDWLDPDNTEITELPSLQNISGTDIVDIHGSIKDPAGRAVSQAVIHVTGSVTQTITAGSNGEFTLSGVNRNGSYVFTPEKDINLKNGLNVIDLVLIQKHLLGKDTFDFEWQYIAADATNNLNVNVGDILSLSRLLLGKITYLPGSASWRFSPRQITVTDVPPGNPVEIEFTAIKVGDVNATADPDQ